MSTTGSGSSRSLPATSTSTASALATARRITWLDVFTREPLSGNPLAVVHDADGLSDDAMHAFARETRLSETTFVQSASEPGADYRNRIWMPSGEIPFAGHPSLGTAVAVARERGLAEADLTQQTIAGLQRCSVLLDGEVATTSMHQEPVRFGAELPRGEALAALNLPPDAADPRLPEQIVWTGVSQVIAPVGDPAALAAARPDMDAVREMTQRFAALVIYLVHVDTATGSARARGFIGSTGLEDPATGSAAGPLCAHVAERTGVERLEIVQGVEMGRRSVLRAEIDGDRVRVSGDVVVVFEGSIYLDG